MSQYRRLGLAATDATVRLSRPDKSGFRRAPHDPTRLDETY